MTIEEMARLGGLARNKKLTAEQKSAIGKKAIAARWAKYYKLHPKELPKEVPKQ